MQVVLFFLLTVFSFGTLKAAPIFGVGMQGRMSKDDEGSFRSQFLPLAFVGYKTLPWIFLGEASFFSQKTEASYAFNIKTNHYELSGYAMRFLSFEDGRVINPYVIGGLTVMQDRVIQNFNNLQSKSSSQYYAGIKAGAGLWAQFLDHCFATSELKAMYSADYAPQLIFGLSVRIGYQF